MLKALLNPLLLLVVMSLCAWVLTAPPGDADGTFLLPETWLLALCATGCVVNGALALARGLSHRPALMVTVWSIAYLIIGSCAWVLVSQGGEVSPETAAKYHQFLKEEGRSPYAADSEGDSTLSLAVLMGKSRVVGRLLRHTPPTEEERRTALPAAALLAAANGDEACLRVLLEAGVPADAVVNGTPLLCEAVNSGKAKAVSFLLGAGAPVNAATDEGNTPLMFAVMNDAPALVRLLTEHGANPDLRNAEGRSAADFSRSSAID